MDTPSIKLEKILKKKSLYVTKQRVSIFNLLLSEDNPLTIEAISKKLRNQLDLVTAYRTIESFKKLGIVKKVYVRGKYRIELTELFKPHHHHLSCNKCKEIIPITLGPKLESTIQKFGNKHGFKITSHEVELSGLCRKCQKIS